MNLEPQIIYIQAFTVNGQIKLRKTKKRTVKTCTQLLAYRTSARVFFQEVQLRLPYVLLEPRQWQSTGKYYVRVK